jgi:glutaredoxin-related protein
VVEVAFRVPPKSIGGLALVLVLLYRRDSEPVFDAVRSHAVIPLPFVIVPGPEAVMVPASDQPF